MSPVKILIEMYRKSLCTDDSSKRTRRLIEILEDPNTNPVLIEGLYQANHALEHMPKNCSHSKLQDADQIRWEWEEVLLGPDSDIEQGKADFKDGLYVKRKQPTQK